jgi:hypothetical protein
MGAAVGGSEEARDDDSVPRPMLGGKCRLSRTIAPRAGAWIEPVWRTPQGIAKVASRAGIEPRTHTGSPIGCRLSRRGVDRNHNLLRCYVFAKAPLAQGRGSKPVPRTCKQQFLGRLSRRGARHILRGGQGEPRQTADRVARRLTQMYRRMRSPGRHALLLGITGLHPETSPGTARRITPTFHLNRRRDPTICGCEGTTIVNRAVPPHAEDPPARSLYQRLN